MTAIEIAPVVKTIEVARSAEDAFQLFTARMGGWWPTDTHSRAQSKLGEKVVSVTVEPRVGGRVFETLQDGRTLDWAEVLAFEPGKLFEMSWRLGREQTQWSIVAVAFDALGPSRCRVTLTHSGWENTAEGAKTRESYNNGWVKVFEQGFAAFAERA